MNDLVPSYLTPFILTGSIAAIATLLFGLQRALGRAGWPEQERNKLFLSVSGLLGAWFIFALLTSWAGWYAGAGRRVPTLQYGLFIPIVVGVLLFRASRMLRRALAAVPQQWIVGIQFYRALGVIFLILYAGGRLPGLFAFPAGIGDVLVGLLAPFAAMAYARSGEAAAGRVRLWNWLGISDLVIAVTAGFLTSPSPVQMAAFDRPNVLISMFPLVLIPVYMVPISILLHFASLYRLRGAERSNQVTVNRGFPSAAKARTLGDAERLS